MYSVFLGHGTEVGHGPAMVTVGVVGQQSSGQGTVMVATGTIMIQATLGSGGYVGHKAAMCEARLVQLGDLN